MFSLTYTTDIIGVPIGLLLPAIQDTYGGSRPCSCG